MTYVSKKGEQFDVAHREFHIDEYTTFKLPVRYSINRNEVTAEEFIARLEQSIADDKKK